MNRSLLTALPYGTKVGQLDQVAFMNRSLLSALPYGTKVGQLDHDTGGFTSLLGRNDGCASIVEIGKSTFVSCFNI